MKPSNFDKNMADASFAQAEAKKKVAAQGSKAVKAALWGLGSACLLALVFVNEDLVTDLFTRGKWFAALPIASVFIFTFVHSAFAHNFLSALGIEPKRKK